MKRHAIDATGPSITQGGGGGREPRGHRPPPRSSSTCGSAQKTPDASFKMLRGRPGRLTFKRGEMAKEFENVASRPSAVCQSSTRSSGRT